MANPYAGEAVLVVNGQPQVLKLTLGALAELETGLAEDTLLGLIERFESGDFASRDVLALIVAGLRGGGWQGQARDLMQADIEGGALEAARIAAQLLVLAFGTTKAVAHGDV
ncbi:gene transfer agent family protein [Shimia sp.]|uniref:gene transfer agent family protein n=1 Tax=Shimia sp. TaxID=1954381 RepID=UPI003B8C0FDA